VKVLNLDNFGREAGGTSWNEFKSFKSFNRGATFKPLMTVQRSKFEEEFRGDTFPLREFSGRST
jgi:hypothetical protein